MVGARKYRIRLKPDTCASDLAKQRASVHRTVATAVLLVFVLLSFRYELVARIPQLRASIYHQSYKSAKGQTVTAPMTPKGMVLGPTELFYALPSGPRVQGVLLFFHGCHRTGQDLFRLPEDRVVAAAALNRNLAVLSITAMDSTTRCWSGRDAAHLSRNRVVDQWIDAMKLPSSLPRIAMGASSGGSFLFSIYRTLKIRSMASYISSSGFDAKELPNSPDPRRRNSSVPPTVFVHMVRDADTASYVHYHKDALEKAGVPTKVFGVQSHPLTEELCDQRLPEVGDRRCRLFVQTVSTDYPTLLEPETHTVLSPYDDQWKNVLKESKFDDDLRHTVGTTPVNKGEATPTATSGHSWMWEAVQQEIETAYAQHEMTCEYHTEVLNFLMKHASIGAR